ncbi:MAG: HypC/HybG/HupF family hydrogenase formation chaperone [Bryobacterales bacterium]|nr:HypC/HybG/HupF family hydrogenase formation chaperone [Bryobacterales bacterium]
MCLAIPGQVLDVYEANGARMGRVDFGGITKEVCLTFVPEAMVGDYAIVHAGFALSRVDERSALESLATFRELGLIEEELGITQPSEETAGEADTP